MGRTICSLSGQFHKGRGWVCLVLSHFYPGRAWHTGSRDENEWANEWLYTENL